ncbi:hypothetical protein BO70DRAFT_422478, partial [Aspergillus heteromorphus CBS 117.55]
RSAFTHVIDFPGISYAHTSRDNKHASFSPGCSSNMRLCPPRDHPLLLPNRLLHTGCLICIAISLNLPPPRLPLLDRISPRHLQLLPLITTPQQTHILPPGPKISDHLSIHQHPGHLRTHQPRQPRARSNPQTCRQNQHQIGTTALPSSFSTASGNASPKNTTSGFTTPRTPPQHNTAPPHPAPSPASAHPDTAPCMDSTAGSSSSRAPAGFCLPARPRRVPAHRYSA